MAPAATWLAVPATKAPELDELTAAQLEALYAELEIITDRIGDLLRSHELYALRFGLERAKVRVYARLATPIQRLMDGDR